MREVRFCEEVHLVFWGGQLENPLAQKRKLEKLPAKIYKGK